MSSQPNLKPFTIKGSIDITSGQIAFIQIINDQNSTETIVQNPSTYLIMCIETENISEVKKILEQKIDPNMVYKSGRSALKVAVDKNNLKIVKALIEAGADINRKEGLSKISAFNYVCYGLQEEIVKYLLSLPNVDINSCDGDGDTPLHNACRRGGNINIIKMLLEKNADYTKKNDKNLTPLDICKINNLYNIVELLEEHINFKENIKNPSAYLIKCIETENISEVKKLLEQKIDPTIVSKLGKSAFEVAIDKNNLEIVKALIEAGADINRKEGLSKISAFNHACFGHKEKIVEYLLSLPNVDINSCDRDNDTPLHNAGRNGGNFNIVKMLLEKNADYTKKNNKNLTPLDICKINNLNNIVELLEEHINFKENIKNPSAYLIKCIEAGNVSEVKKLLEQKIDPNAVSESSRNALKVAIDKNNLEIVKLLVEAGADINKKSGIADLSAFNYACHIHKEEIVKYLLSLPNVDINSCDLDNDTPLHNACRNGGNFNILTMLLEKNADYTKKNNMSQTPMDICKKSNLVNFAKLLEEHINFKENIKNPSEYFIKCVETENVSEIKKLLEQKIDPNAVSESGINVLGIAIDKNNLEIFKLLVEAGADINKKFGSFETSVFNYACFVHNEKIVEYLLSLPNVDINSCDGHGDTPLHNAGRKGGNINIVKMLLEKDADYTKKNNNGQTPSQLYMFGGNYKLTNLIEEYEYINSKEKSQNTPVVANTDSVNPVSTTTADSDSSNVVSPAMTTSSNSDFVKFTLTANGKTINYEGPKEIAKKIIKDCIKN